MNAALTFDLWQIATRFADAKGVLQSGDRVVHWSWCPEAEALGHDCTSVPEGFHLAAVRIEPSPHNNSEYLLRIFRLPKCKGPGHEVFRVRWDMAEGEPTQGAGLNVEKFERGLWEAALRERARVLEAA